MHGTDDFKNYMKSAYTIETDTRVIAGVEYESTRKY